jgi:hypothetical protein
MRWCAAHFPKVVWRVDEASPEVVVPDPIDNGAPCQRVCGVCQPMREGGAPCRFVC